MKDSADTGRKLNLHKTFRIRPGRLLNVLCTFNLRPLSTGRCRIILGKFWVTWKCRTKFSYACGDRMYGFRRLCGTCELLTLNKTLPTWIFFLSLYSWHWLYNLLLVGKYLSLWANPRSNFTVNKQEQPHWTLF